MPTLFRNVQVFDGTGSQSFRGEVLVEGNKITQVARGKDVLRCDGATVVDRPGATLMPGLVESHTHLSYCNVAKLESLGEIPPEENVLAAMANAKLMLDCGFTSLYSGASSKVRTDIAVRNALASGMFPGPRFRAASPELTSTGSLGDVAQLHMPHESFGYVADGADEVRRAVRMFAREGVDIVKVNISSDNYVRPHGGENLAYSEAEIAAASEEAHQRGVWLSAHARADASVQLAVKYGFRMIYHCEYIEGETFDHLESVRDKVFVAPTYGGLYSIAYEAGTYGLTEDIAEQTGAIEALEGFPAVVQELLNRGVRVLPGGDYAFAWNPIGNDARDLQHFVEALGFTPAQALMAATKWGGELMDMGKLGLVEPDYLADLILVDGDPLDDITVLQDTDRIVLVMKDGVVHKDLTALTAAAVPQPA
ncbi:MAG: hypothetical protein ABS81_04985 [Pseudonocardia sp. SCN 72-86]|nr:MAG: hypothetical protein ABS81_04985 [Pseudonocardia sp. SCN 72-86]